MFLPIVFLFTTLLLLFIAIFLVRRYERGKLVGAVSRLEKVHDDFSAKLVHELRAPLTVIRGAADMFIKDPTLAAKSEGQQILSTIRQSSEDMLTMINDLLDVYKIEAGKFQIIKTSNNLADIVNDRVVFFRQLATSKGINLSVELPEYAATVDLDRERISQVLNNLLSNAIKYTPGAGRIIVSMRKIESVSDIHWRFGPIDHLEIVNLPTFLISISDTGEGIASEDMKDLFSKFKQLHPIDGQGGSGLGLAIAKGIIESHGGQVFLESRPKEGTTVYFTVPIKSRLDN